MATHVTFLLLLFLKTSVTLTPTESESFCALFDSIPSLTNFWDTSLCTNPCTLQGVTCDTNQTNLEAITMNNYNLSGSIPTHIGNFYYLRQLYFQNNAIFGAIPKELGNCVNLQLLNLNLNKLNGTFPSQLGNLASLFFLQLERNYLSGRIPQQIGKLSYLLLLDLQHNEFDGEIPTQIGNLGIVGTMYLNDNKLNSTIPTQLANDASLKYLYLNNNYLHGTIPTQLAKLPVLQDLELSNNKLVGELPEILLSAPSLVKLNVSHNLLKGTIPSMYAYFNGSLGLFGNKLSCPTLSVPATNKDYIYYCASTFIIQENEQSNLTGSQNFSLVSILPNATLDANDLQLTTNDILINQNTKLILTNSSISVEGDMTVEGNITLTFGINSSTLITSKKNLIIKPNTNLIIELPTNFTASDETLISFTNIEGSFNSIAISNPTCDVKVGHKSLQIVLVKITVCSSGNMGSFSIIACCLYILLILLLM